MSTDRQTTPEATGATRDEEPSEHRGLRSDDCAGESGRRPARTAAKWGRWARWVGYLILAAASAWGLHGFATGDAAATAAFWLQHSRVLPAVMLLAALDVTVEVTVWTWVYHRFGMRSRDLTGVSVGLSGKAGLLLPAQLGRLVRPDLMARLGRGTLAEGLKAEVVIFVLDATSVAALLAALVCWRVQPVLGPMAAVAVIGSSLLLGDRILGLLSGTPFVLPAGFWRSWETAATVCVQMLGWTAHGLAFYALASGLPGEVGLWEAVVAAPGAAVLGVASGIPGGVGATEVLLGASLGLGGVPAEHLALGVAAFRVVTFWLLIPVGWLALAYASRQARRRGDRRRALREAGDGDEMTAVDPTDAPAAMRLIHPAEHADR